MKTLEIRLDPTAVRPFVDHLRLVVDGLEDELATSAVSPDEDELMSGIWHEELMLSQNADLATVMGLFDEEFLDTGRTRVSEEDADRVLRGCSALRLRLREITLKGVSDEELEAGEIDFEAMNAEERVGYGSYSLLASFQELIVAQIYG